MKWCNHVYRVSVADAVYGVIWVHSVTIEGFG